METLGYYAKDKDNNLFKFRWGADNTFYIINNNVESVADVKDYEILEICYTVSN